MFTGHSSSPKALTHGAFDQPFPTELGRWAPQEEESAIITEVED
jgi:hypothetical protein